MKFFKRESPKTTPPIPTPKKRFGLQRLTLFSHLSEYDLSQLYHAATTKHFQKNEFVIREGEHCSCFYIMLDGKVKIVHMNNMFSNVFNRGDFFGNIYFNENIINKYSAIALKNLTVMEINHGMISHFSENVQLIIYRKINELSMDNISKIEKGYDRISKRNTELTTYIRSMRSQTHAFIT